MTFVDFVKEKCTLEQRIWVYGFGTSGRLFTDLCLQNGIKVNGIIVGDGYKDAESYKEVPVFEVKDNFLHAGQLFYTVKSKIENTVSDAVISMFSIIDLSSRKDYDSMLEIYYAQYWKKKNVRIVMEDNANWKFFFGGGGGIMQYKTDGNGRVQELPFGGRRFAVTANLG